jgi:hypothetical protein
MAAALDGQRRTWVFDLVDLEPPTNSGPELAKRNLDKAVVDYMHMLREKRGINVNRMYGPDAFCKALPCDE